jgi:hypothetical protein
MANRTAILSHREVAMVRYGMEGLTDVQIAALLGKTREHINLVRNGKKGPPMAKPPTPPAVRSRMEANSWFVAKAIKTLEAWMAMLAELERQGQGADLDKMVQEADYEGEPQRKKRRGRPFKHKLAQHPATSGTSEFGAGAGAVAAPGLGHGADKLPGGLPQGQAADANRIQGEHRVYGAGAGTAGQGGGDPGLIMRRRR